VNHQREVARVVLGVCAGAVLLLILAPVQGTMPNGGAGAQLTLGGPCLEPDEPNAPSPAPGSVDVPVDTQLAWKVPMATGCARFRLLASTGGIFAGPHPFSLVELMTDPVNEVAIGSAYSIGFVTCLDASPDGVLYGVDAGLCAIDSNRGTVRTISESVHTRAGVPVSLNGMAFHPDGTLYGVEWDLDTDDNVFYTIDPDSGVATEVCRIPSYEGDAWGIDFSPDGVLYGAFCELVRFDLAQGTATMVGPFFSLPFVGDIDYAPDGFIYAVDMFGSLFQINPSTGRMVQQYGPYDSELWGIASECVATSSSDQSAGASIQALSAPVAGGSSTLSESAGALAAQEEAVMLAKRGLLLDHLGARGEAPTAPVHEEPAPLISAAALNEGNDVICDVYLDTVNPPVKMVACGVLPPAMGDVWTCDPGVLRPDLTYYWQVVARNACGVAKAGPLWSFRTKGPIFRDTFASATIDPAKWAVVKDATIDDKGLNETSAPYSLRLNAYPNGGDSVESAVLDLSGYPQVTLSFWYEQGANLDDPEETEDLVVEYYNGVDWKELDRQLGRDPAMTSYRCVTVPLPAEALTAQFKLRFRSTGTAAGGGPFVNDDWFVDDVTLSAD
jgi:hypothetical protein